jgi:hypothetical protein
LRHAHKAGASGAMLRKLLCVENVGANPQLRDTVMLAGILIGRD